MAGLDDDEEYSDEDLDAIAGEEFFRLQQQAFQATQRPQTAATTQGSGLGNTNASRLATSNNNSDSFGPDRYQNQSSDYGDLDEEVLDAGIIDAPNVIAFNASRANAKDEVSQREQWRLNRFGAPAHNFQSEENRHASINTILPRRESTSNNSLPLTAAGNVPTLAKQVADFKSEGSNATLEDRVKQLLAEKKQWEEEREILRQGVKTAQEEVFGKKGEISIIRSNHAKQERDRERQINDLKQQQAEAEERHKRALEQARKEKESLITHNRFLDHEVSESTWQNIGSKRSSKNKAQATSMTPKRQRSKAIGDGFNDDEITMSPSKSIAKPKAATPKNGAKRKRDVTTESPGYPLPLKDEAGSFLQDASAALKADLTSTDPQISISSTTDSRFDFLQMLLAHRVEPGLKRTFEVFATFTFPSKPNVAVSTLLLDKMGSSNIQHDKQDFPGSIGAIVLSIWSKCLNEQYYTPVYYLVDLVKFILLKGTSATVNQLVYDITMMAQLTADVNVIPRFQTLNKNARPGVTSKDLSEHPSDEIDVKSSLELLTLTATLCMRDQHLSKPFWMSMRVDFISMLLRAPQHIDDIVMAVKLLAPCVQEDMLGVIRDPDTSTGLTSEQHIIDRLTSMLIETPRPLNDDEPYNPVDVINMRLEILQLLEQLCDNKLSGQAFAAHPQALGRVVRAMNDELTAMYMKLSGREQRAEIVNHACRVVFHVTLAYSPELNLQEKLRSQPGGVNKYLIALSRLAFSDGIFFERDIDEDVLDCAHQMLEDFVSPEEADALRAAFVKEDR